MDDFVLFWINFANGPFFTEIMYLCLYLSNGTEIPELFNLFYKYEKTIQNKIAEHSGPFQNKENIHSIHSLFFATVNEN